MLILGKAMQSMSLDCRQITKDYEKKTREAAQRLRTFSEKLPELVYFKVRAHTAYPIPCCRTIPLTGNPCRFIRSLPCLYSSARSMRNDAGSMNPAAKPCMILWWRVFGV
jgi:hypothetical protein